MNGVLGTNHMGEGGRRERFLTTAISEKIQGKGEVSREDLGGCDSDALCRVPAPSVQEASEQPFLKKGGEVEPQFLHHALYIMN